jgi:putative oxidoreductase
MTKTTDAMQDSTNNRGLNIALWIVQALLATVFLMAGVQKLQTAVAGFAQKAPGFSQGLFKFIGVAEVAGALGLILPAATRIMPRLTPWAGVGLMTVMILATGFHISRGELSNTLVTVPLGLLAAFVAWGRFFKAPIGSRPSS